MLNKSVHERFNEIYDLTNKAVRAFVTAKCGNTADIADIVQDTYVEVYQVLMKRGSGYVRDEKAFVLKIARQKLSRYYTLADRLGVLFFTRNKHDDFGLSELEQVADSFLTEDYVVDRAMLDEVREFLLKKPQDVRKVFYLFYDVEFTIPQIAAELGMSESNVKHKLYRTLNEIREKLE
jgi:RNA polymerase sigma-70 factor (ECF subfamily)